MNILAFLLIDSPAEEPKCSLADEPGDIPVEEPKDGLHEEHNGSPAEDPQIHSDEIELAAR